MTPRRLLSMVLLALLVEAAAIGVLVASCYSDGDPVIEKEGSEKTK